MRFSGRNMITVGRMQGLVFLSLAGQQFALINQSTVPTVAKTDSI